MIYLGIFKAYLKNYMYILLSCVTILVLLPLLLSISDFYKYYYDVKSGFLPSVIVRYSDDVPFEKIKAHKEEISNEFETDLVMAGVSNSFKKAAFLLGGGLKGIEKDIALYAMDFDGDKTIKLEQGSSVFTVEVRSIIDFGSWIITIDSVEGLKEEDAYLYVDSVNKIKVAVNSFFGSTRVEFDADEDSESRKLFYTFLTDFVSRFIDLKYSGVGSDKIFINKEREGELSREDIYFESHMKNKILSYLALILDNYQDKRLSVLISNDLLKDISNLGRILNTKISNEEKSLNVMVHGGFSFKTEGKLENNVVLINYSAFKEANLFDKSNKVLYVYTEERGTASKIKEFVVNNFDKTDVILRKELLPTLEREFLFVKAGIGFMFTLFVSIVASLFLIKLLKFYSIFKDELLLMNLYGFRGLAFNLPLSVILVLSNIISFVLLNLLFDFNNKILAEYFYPSIDLNLMFFLYASVVCLLIVFINIFVEIFLQRNIMYISRRD